MACSDSGASTAVALDSEGHAFELRPWHCPTCGPAARHTLGRRGGRYQRYGRGVETAVVECRSCGLIFPDPFPVALDPQSLYGHPDEYFSGANEHPDLEPYRELVREVARRTGDRSPSILDVGSGRGELLAAAGSVGVEAIGIELSRAFCEAAADTYGVHPIVATIEEYAGSVTRVFDCVVINGVLEHVIDPDSMIRAAARLTRTGGVLYLDVPNEPNLLTQVGNALNRLRGSPGVFNLAPTWPPYHVYAFNPRSISMLLQKHGFYVEGIRINAGVHVPSQGALGDRLAAFVATQLNRLANLTGTAEDMKVWAKRAS